MQTSDGPTNPQIRSFKKNRQVNSGSFTPHTVSPMQHVQAVIVSLYAFGKQERDFPFTCLLTFCAQQCDI